MERYSALQKMMTSILKNSKTQKQLNQNIKNWMDGFKTLKLIHYLRDFAFPNENMFSSVNYFLEKFDEKPIDISDLEIPNFETQLRILQQLRSLT